MAHPVGTQGCSPESEKLKQGGQGREQLEQGKQADQSTSPKPMDKSASEENLSILPGLQMLGQEGAEVFHRSAGPRQMAMT